MSTRKKKTRPTHRRKVLTAAQERKIVAASQAKRISKEFAQNQVRRELAAWVMSLRSRALELYHEVWSVHRACRDEASLLFGLVEEQHLVRLLDAGQAFNEADTELLSIVIDCTPPNVVAIAKNYQDSWGLHPEHETGGAK